MGLGRFGGGTGVARWLAHQGADVLVTDLADASALQPSITELADLSIEYRLGRHQIEDLNTADLVVVNPAVARERSAFFQEVLRRKIPWTTEILLFVERCPGRLIGITGTAGKSTTAAMIHHVLQRACDGGPIFFGGNIGRSLLQELPAITPLATVVLELSSFQLADFPRITRRPDISVIVNLWPHHLDRHGSFDDYLDCKLNILKGAPAGQTVVLGFDDPALVARARAANPHLRFQLASSPDVPPFDLRIPGQHNQVNARCAAGACTAAGVAPAAIRDALASFDGLPHRLQFVERLAGVDYYNDSKATSPGAAVTALRSFDRPVIVLLGGKCTDAPTDDLISGTRAVARAVICFGEVGPELLKRFTARQVAPPNDGAPGFATNVADDSHGPAQVYGADSLADAVNTARSVARGGDVVLLSPGFPSYDAFANYEQRGDAFTAAVRRLL